MRVLVWTTSVELSSISFIVSLVILSPLIARWCYSPFLIPWFLFLVFPLESFNSVLISAEALSIHVVHLYH